MRSQKKTDDEIGHSTVMLSIAKHLEVHGDRPFAAAQGDNRGRRQAGPCCHAARAFRSQQGTGPRPHPRRVTMKVTPTDRPAFGLSLWRWLMLIGRSSWSHWHLQSVVQA